MNLKPMTKKERAYVLKNSNYFSPDKYGTKSGKK